MQCRILVRLIALMAIGLATTNCYAQEFAQVPQSWTGVLDANGNKLRLRFDIESDRGKLTCTLTSIDQGNSRIRMDSCQISDGKLVVRNKRLLIVFEGSYDKDKQLLGTFTQAGQSFELNLTAAKPPKPKKHVETWLGTMKAGPRSFEFQYRVFEDADKVRTVELDSLSESLAGLYVEPTFEEARVSFKVPVSRAEFKGEYNEQRTKISGQWLQGGGNFPLTLNKVALSATKSVQPPKRPQTPKLPYSYDVEEVTFENAADKIELAGTLTIPKGAGPYPAAVLITGSGPQDRDESLMGHKPFLVLADHLTNAGIAVLRYDERGVGQSTGEFGTANSTDLSRDVEAAMDYLRRQPRIDANRTGLVGHSEGGLVAPMIASRRHDVAFIVMLAGPGVPGDQIILNQSERIGKAAGMSPEDLDLNRRVLQVALVAIRSASAENVAESVEKAVADFIGTLSEEDQKNPIIKATPASVDRMTSVWFRFFLQYDPRPALQKVSCPTLVLNGEKDLQVDPKLNLPEIRRALQAGGNDQFEVHELAGLNHLFQTCTTGAPSEYRLIEETFAPAALAKISKWIHSLTR